METHKPLVNTWKIEKKNPMGALSVCARARAYAHTWDIV